MKQRRLPLWRCLSVVLDSPAIAPVHKLVPTFFWLFGANFVLFTLLYSFFPSKRFLITQEDNLVETCSVILYISVFFLSLFKAFLYKNNNSKLFILSGIAILGFLDELSYGERTFSLSMPTLMGMKIDSIHDLVYVARNLILGYVIAHPERGFLALGGLLGLLVFVLLKWKSKIRALLTFVLGRATTIFALTFIVLGLTAVFIDLELIHNEYLFAMEEVLEMNAALCLFFLCLSFRKSAGRLI